MPEPAAAAPAPAAEPAAPASAAAAAAAAAPAAPGEGAPAAPSVDVSDKWYSGVDEKHHGLIENRHWENMDSVLDSYDSLYKLRGVSEDQLMKMPAPEDVEGMGEIYNRLGRPETAEGYTFEKTDDWTPEYTEWFGKTMHEMGLNDKQASLLQQRHTEFEAAALEKMEADISVTQVNEMTVIKQEWGSAYDEKMAAVGSGAAKLGWTQEQIKLLERVVGTNKMMNTMAMIGESIGEASFPGGDSSSIPARSEGLTREAADSKYKEMLADPEFRKRLTSSDDRVRKQAMAERSKISKLAYD